ncbi:MAG: trypsin-like peptidase domain-containing protein [Acidobacteriia bacterium]|nr:trypsin-like peptidase domain-containing protein [Terriglobia bacterium]
MKLRTFLIAAALVGVFVFLTSRQNSTVRNFWAGRGGEWTGPTVAHSAGLSADETNNIEIYKAAKESVVYITSTTYQRDFFFGVQAVQGLGSGFIINADGQILTNYHVISGSSDVEVTMPPDQSRYRARILMRDQAHDLALIQIDPKKKLTSFLKLGDSDSLQVGQKVLAIGNPFGLAGTLTTGIVSSLHRKIQSEERGDLEDMIQTDAAINSGNSGGPLLDSQGSVIGLNTAIYGPNGGSVGIGFAMPINRAKVMLGDFRSGRRPASSTIGVSTYLISGDWAEALKLPRTGGLLIGQVARGTPASAAGLRGGTQVVRIGNGLLRVGGDLITAVDGKKVEEENAITRAVALKHAGDTLDLTIWRDGRTMDVKVTLAEQGEGVL